MISEDFLVSSVDNIETGIENTYSRQIGPVNVDVSTQGDAVRRLKFAIERGIPGAWGFCNAHTVNMAYTYPSFRRAIARMKMFNDGFGVDIASKILYGRRFPENVNGTDLTPVLLESLAAVRLFLVGSAAGVAEMAADAISAQYPNVSVVGTHHGFFGEQDELLMADDIARSGAQLVLVGMGHPRQEVWAARNFERFNAPVLCVGAYIDRSAGLVSRPPMMVRRMRCEWLYRLALEPRRLAKRYIVGNPRFIGRIARQKLQQSRYGEGKYDCH